MKKSLPAILALEDGTVFKGEALGWEGEAAGEVVFNTSMSGYQEILTDPSYKGQIVTMTYPLIGNYGINDEDGESRRPWVEGFVVKESSPISSNWRSRMSLEGYLKTHRIAGIRAIDTRALTRHIRLQGAMRGVISAVDLDADRLVDKARSTPSLIGRDLVREVTCKEPYVWQEPLPLDDFRGCDAIASHAKSNHADMPGGKREGSSFKVVVVDCGVKFNILRSLISAGAEVEVVSAFTRATDILSQRPDGVVFSNGPGDPAGVGYVIKEMKSLLGKLPILGVCLGHQLLGLALGARTYKLKFGHHGGNHPVMDLATQKVAITSQNHGFAVEEASLKDRDVEVTHINLYDRTIEGIRSAPALAFSIQYHPEASPGPHDARYLFAEFIQAIREGK